MLFKSIFGLLRRRPKSLPLYKGVRDAGRALKLLKDALHNDESKRRRAVADLEVLQNTEYHLFELGKDAPYHRKLIIAKNIKELRGKARNILHKIDIYDRRIKILSNHIRAIETAVEIENVELPNEKAIENAINQARERLTELFSKEDMVDDVARTFNNTELDREEEDILRNLTGSNERSTSAQHYEKESMIRNL